jgi:hypothetical protein
VRRRLPAWGFALSNGLAFLCIAMALTCRALPAQRVVTTERNWTQFVTPGEVPEFAEAVTKCSNGKPVVHIKGFDTLSTERIQEIWAHERVHVEQFNSRDTSLTCEQFESAITNVPQLLANIEAQAYCASALYKRQHYGEDALIHLIAFAAGESWIFNSFNDPAWRVAPPVMIALFLRTCPQVR